MNPFRSPSLIARRWLAAGALSFSALLIPTIAAAQSTWYFTEGNFAHLVETSSWNSQPDGSGTAPETLDSMDAWILGGTENAVIGGRDHVFEPTLTVEGNPIIGGYEWGAHATYLANAEVGTGQKLRIRASADGVSGIGIDDLRLDGSMEFMGFNPLRSVAVLIEDLTGGGIIDASAPRGLEGTTSSLNASGDWSGFTGTVRFQNNTGFFRGTADPVNIRSGQLFIERAEDPQHATIFLLNREIIVGSFNLAGTVFSDPGTYNATQLNELLVDERILFTGGGSITVIRN